MTRKRLTSHANLFSKYFLLAVGVLGIQFAITFFVTTLLRQSHLTAALVSIVAGIFLNWRYSSRLIFGTSKHHPMLEFVLSALVVVSGLGMQMATAKLTVITFHMNPAHSLALVLAFGAAWNYALFKKVVFKI